MNIHIKKHPLKLIALLTLGVCTLIYAAAVFIPSTQPTVQLGQYALQQRDLLDTGTIAYRPWFENGAWQGDVIEYEILQDGTRRTDVAVGANPATQGASDYCGRSGSGCWSARATFISNGADNPTGSYWQTRNIFTNNGGQTNFTWDLLSATQRAALDQDTVDIITAAADPSLNTAYVSDILNYVRGERLHEKQNDAQTGSLGDLRNRFSVLGDVTSTPVYIGPPRELLGRVNGYTSFTSTHATRAGRVAFGANDGMLHVLNPADGSEVYAYIPSMVVGKLGRLAARGTTYKHTFYVDGELTTGSVQIGASTPVWHTILTGGGGAGFPGLFALDVTDPAWPGTSPHDTKLLFEKTGGSWGHIYGRPRLGFIGASNSDPTWYIFTGNGYSTSAGQPTALMMVNLDNFVTTQINVPGSVTGGLSAPVLLSTDADDQVELAFAGDINGDLWMFEIDQTNPANSTATKVYDGSPDRPISNAPAVAEHPTESGYIVYFGTGSLFSINDALNDGESPAGSGNYNFKQRVQGVWVDTANMASFKLGLPYNSTHLQSQTITETTKVFITGDPAENVRIVPSPNNVYYRCPFGVSPCPALHKGWRVDLPNCGERLVGSPFVRAGRVQFVTTNPTGLDCGKLVSEGDSWVMSLDFTQGNDHNTVVYNLNGDDDLDNGDAVLVSGVYKPPVGLSLGPGNISQPSFVRLKAGVDKMFINGLLLPIAEISEPGSILGGHIDVTTDSPTGGVIAPNNRNKHSEGYHIRSNDGLGRGVDGHVHDYDGIHDVDYVDLFQLEKRRGKASLLAALGVTSPGPTGTVTCSTAENTKEILVTGTPNDSCIPAVEGELNRAYDTLHTDADGNLEALNGSDPTTGLPAPVLQSEVHAFNATNPPDYTTAVPAQQFIVVLANADRSTGGILQIGCKIWNVVDYQDMITARLQDGRTTTSGLVDDGGNSLVFTLADILTEDPDFCPGGRFNTHGTNGSRMSILEARNLGLSTQPTLRVAFGGRSILDGGLHATRAQCVLGLHDPEDKVCLTDSEVLELAEFALASPGHDPGYSQPTSCGGISIGADPGYIRDPDQQRHITEAPAAEGQGYRWRNGALTVQLLDAAIDPDDDLQDPGDLLSGAGTFAQAFDITGNGANRAVTATSAEETANESGLLYEATMFWHYSDLVDKIRNSDPSGNTTPQDAPCYGNPNYNGTVVIDKGGLTLGEYQALTNPLVADCQQVQEANEANGTNVTCDLKRFFQLLAIIENAQTEAELNQALMDLASLLANNALLKAYAEMREYAGDKIPTQNKLPGDRDGGDDVDDPPPADGTPADVVTIETIDLEARGPNFVFGRRNWVDIQQ